MSSDSSDLETSITQKIKQKRAPSTKNKAKPTTIVVQGQGRNDGDDPRRTYEPPKDARLLDHTVDAGEFEWDTINDDEDTEIWLIRVPDSIKSKHLDGLEIDQPSPSRTARIGSITRKNASYDVWSIGDDDDTEAVGGEELHGLSCLLPRKKKDGKLYTAPKPVSRHIVISAQPSVTTIPEHQPIIYQNPPRRSYPKEVLKHTFVPYGARSEQVRSTDLSMDVDDIEIAAEKPPQTAQCQDKPAKVKPVSKKRKVDVETSKRSKKHKVHS